MAAVSEGAADAYLSQEKLAKQLMECAILVKRGERKSPVFRQTITALAEYLSVQPAVLDTTTTTNNHHGTTTTTSDHESIHPASTVSQPLKPIGVMLGKMMGMTEESSTIPKTQAQKQATSHKNAQRMKAEIVLEQQEQWNEEQMTTTHTTAAAAAAVDTPAAAAVKPRAAAVVLTASSRPAFSRPNNPKTPTIIANGWIEQQRRSKLRHVWKDVLASLVESRKAGEETTLWIQRQVVTETGRAELEALHQIPVKWLEAVKYHHDSVDNRFTLKIYNLDEPFDFRCPKDQEAAQNWVLTLRSMQQEAQRKAGVTTGLDGWDHPVVPSTASGQQQEEKKDSSIPHRAATQAAAAPKSSSSNNQRMSVAELRAIAHGAGVQTHGMERGQLEEVVARIQSGNPAYAAKMPTAATATAAATDIPQSAAAQQQAAAAAAALKKKEAEELAARQRKLEEQRQRQQMEDEAAAQRRVEEAAMRKKRQEEEEAAERQRVREQQQEKKRREEEEEGARLKEERIRRDEEELRRRQQEQAAQEQARRQQEQAQRAQAQWAQQQQQWQAQQEEQRRQQQAADEQRRRQQEEAYRLYQQQQAAYAAQQQQHAAQQPYTAQQHAAAHAQWQQQQAAYAAAQQQQQHAHAAQHQQQQVPPPYPHQQPPRAQHSTTTPPRGATYQQQRDSPINMKYAKMAQAQDSEVAITNLKHGILVQWALQPPMLQVLRPIEELICSIHLILPPQFGVPQHEYFSKWTAIPYSEISQGLAAGNRPDDAKLKKAMKKLKFFLHPDKLPRDLGNEQKFVCKLMWDIVQDAEAEHKKREEDLGWIRG